MIIFQAALLHGSKSSDLGVQAGTIKIELENFGKDIRKINGNTAIKTFNEKLRAFDDLLKNLTAALNNNNLDGVLKSQIIPVGLINYYFYDFLAPCFTYILKPLNEYIDKHGTDKDFQALKTVASSLLSKFNAIYEKFAGVQKTQIKPAQYKFENPEAVKVLTFVRNFVAKGGGGKTAFPKTNMDLDKLQEILSELEVDASDLNLFIVAKGTQGEWRPVLALIVTLNNIHKALKNINSDLSAELANNEKVQPELAIKFGQILVTMVDDIFNAHFLAMLQKHINDWNTQASDQVVKDNINTIANMTKNILELLVQIIAKFHDLQKNGQWDTTTPPSMELLSSIRTAKTSLGKGAVKDVLVAAKNIIDKFDLDLGVKVAEKMSVEAPLVKAFAKKTETASKAFEESLNQLNEFIAQQKVAADTSGSGYIFKEIKQSWSEEDLARHFKTVSDMLSKIVEHIKSATQEADAIKELAKTTSMPSTGRVATPLPPTIANSWSTFLAFNATYLFNEILLGHLNGNLRTTSWNATNPKDKENIQSAAKEIKNSLDSIKKITTIMKNSFDEFAFKGEREKNRVSKSFNDALPKIETKGTPKDILEAASAIEKLKIEQAPEKVKVPPTPTVPVTKPAEPMKSEAAITPPKEVRKLPVPPGAAKIPPEKEPEPIQSTTEGATPASIISALEKSIITLKNLLDTKRKALLNILIPKGGLALPPLKDFADKLKSINNNLFEIEKQIEAFKATSGSSSMKLPLIIALDWDFLVTKMIKLVFNDIFGAHMKKLVTDFAEKDADRVNIESIAYHTKNSLRLEKSITVDISNMLSTSNFDGNAASVKSTRNNLNSHLRDMPGTGSRYAYDIILKEANRILEINEDLKNKPRKKVIDH